MRAGPRGRDPPHYDRLMRHPYLTRAAARLRHTLGLDDLARRLDAIESRLAGATTDRYPNGPVYFGDHTALVATRWGAKMLVDTRDAMVAPWLVLDGLWESTVTDWLQHTLQPGQVFVDVGANIGYFTLLGATLVGPEGTCVGIEAHPRLAELLQRNVIINGLHRYVTTWHRAAWSEAGDLKIHLRRNFASNSSVGSIGADALKRLGDTEKVVEVQAVRLDDLLSDLPRVDVIKVDVEGAEVQVFTGLTRILTSNPAITIIFEWSPAQIADVGDDPGALLDLLSGHGFRFRLIETGLSKIDRAGLLDLPYGNVVATR
jgi:FkbM family methyltransferase